MKKIKVGIIGCGGIANGKHMPSMSKIEEVEIVAFCDIIEEKAIEANEKFAEGKGKVYTDYNELLKSDVDMVCVCTPNNMHCTITVAGLNSNKHVLCEKPMAINYAEALQMIAARDKSGKLLSIGYQGRYRDNCIFLKEECEKGELGEIYYAKAKAIRRRAVPTWGVFLDKEKQGGGSLIDIGTHALDLTLYLMNNYEPAYAVGTTYRKLADDTRTGNAWGDWDPNKFTAEDSAFAFIVMKNGATIALESSWALNMEDEGEAIATLCGTKAGASMDKSYEEVRINKIVNNKAIVSIANFGAGGVAFYSGKKESDSLREAKTFIDAVLGKGELKVKAEEAAVVTRILEGIYESANTGKPYYFN